ncbi:unnamed protein product [Rangifer tarandus platyrhynchus]|uniref:Uncharacterized protein n=1 Tax=Rangifer tarandus platyrhynchus TaxID=3082113 RepID=A0ABN8Z5G2_RANTA|nr:unnamed protein product [Rangifer tarandus platyrhynchus]
MTRVPPAESSPQLSSETRPPPPKYQQAVFASLPAVGGRGAFSPIPAHKERRREQKLGAPRHPQLRRRSQDAAVGVRGRVGGSSLVFRGRGALWEQPAQVTKDRTEQDDAEAGRAGGGGGGDLPFCSNVKLAVFPRPASELG